MKHEWKTNDKVSPHEVDCTAKIQKRMRANLAEAATDRVNLERAGIARAILETTKAKPQAPEAVVKSDSERPPASVVQPVQPAIRTARSKIWQSAKTGFCKLANHISALLPGKRFLRPAHTGV